MKQNRQLIQWGAGILTVIVAVVVAYNLQRVTTLGDRVGDVRKELGEVAVSVDFMRGGLAEIKQEQINLTKDQREMWRDIRAIRISVDRISTKVGLEPVPNEKVPPP